MADEEKPAEEAGAEESRVEQPSEAEVKARAQGWAPKDEWRGPDEKWVDAETFLKRGEQIAPIQAERIEKLTRELEDAKRTIADFAGWRSKVEKDAYERAMKDIKARQREAVKTMDEAAFEAAEKDAQELQKKVEQKTEQPGEAPEVAAWKSANPWFDADPALNLEAQAIHVNIGRTKPGLTLEQNLAEVTKEIKRRYPEKFGIEENPRRKEAPSVEGANGTRTKAGGKSYADLPAEAKAACDSFVKQKIMNREQYVKDYFAMESN